MIYAELLQSSMDPPACPEEAGERWLEKLQSLSEVWYHKDILFPATACNSPALSQCNQQLRHEILGLSQASNFAKHAKYELDVMIVRNSIYPTWICPSPAVDYIKELKISVRVFAGRFRRLRCWRDDKLYLILVPLFAMLGRLLHHSPGSIHQGFRDNGICVDAIIIQGYSVARLRNLTGDKSRDEQNSGMRISKQTSRAMTWDTRVDSIVKQAGTIKRLSVSYQEVTNEYDISTLAEG